MKGECNYRDGKKGGGVIVSVKPSPVEPGTMISPKGVAEIYISTKKYGGARKWRVEPVRYHVSQANISKFEVRYFERWNISIRCATPFIAHTHTCAWSCPTMAE